MDKMPLNMNITKSTVSAMPYRNQLMYQFRMYLPWRLTSIEFSLPMIQNTIGAIQPTYGMNMAKFISAR